MERKLSSFTPCPSAMSCPARSRATSPRSCVPTNATRSSRLARNGRSELPMETRSAVSVLRLTSQPRLTSPTTNSSGTNTSSMKTSLNSAPPVISRNGRTVTPSLFMSTRK
ncbi:Uncharacterised protein [Mycobacteroides abscessus subsp. abscessus]|nr:Uncharacterised protein [Mycobacteroides abscessus subsp. abscessus]